jgi:hypothetical protein
MAHPNLAHRRTHNLLLISKLLSQRDSASPFTLVQDTLEQPAKPLVREYVRRANVSGLGVSSITTTLQADWGVLISRSSQSVIQSSSHSRQSNPRKEWTHSSSASTKRRQRLRKQSPERLRLVLPAANVGQIRCVIHACL